MALKRKDEDVAIDKNLVDANRETANAYSNVYKTLGTNKTGMPTLNLQGFNYTPFSYGNYAEGQNVINARNALNAVNGSRPGEWTGGQYGALLQAAVDKINNREPFKYDLNGDMLYQQYKNQFMNLGRMAMMDTIGQASAMTGGYGNSYANTAGNQAYQGYLQQLNDRVPELYQLAFDKYNQETADLYNEANLNNTLYNQEYGRYRDTVSDWENERNYLSNRYENERSFDYGQYSDAYNRALNTWNANTDAAYRATQMANSNAMSRYEMQNQRYQSELQRLADEAASAKEAEAKAAEKANGTSSTEDESMPYGAYGFLRKIPSQAEYEDRTRFGKSPSYRDYVLDKLDSEKLSDKDKEAVIKKLFMN